MNGIDQASGALEQLGFSPSEARLYLELLRAGPSTGYRIAQVVGKAVANTYKALESLEQRGLVVCEEGDPRIYAAIPWMQASAKFRGEFSKRLEVLSTAVAALQHAGLDEGVYRLSRSEHAYERARRLIGSAQTLVMLDARRDSIEMLRLDLAAAIARGTGVVILTYAPIEVAGATIVFAKHRWLTRIGWPGESLHINSDGRGALIVRLLPEGDAAGFWTESSYIAWVLYCGLASETEESRLAQLCESQPKMSLARAMVSPNYLLTAPPQLIRSERRPLDS